MFNSRIEVKNLPEATNFFKTGKAHLSKPSSEARRKVFEYIDNDVFPKRFNEQKNPAGGRWKPSKRVLKKGGMTLTDKKILRNTMLSDVVIKGAGTLNISMFASESSPARKYAAVHNNGMRIRNRAGRFTKMPKRQFAWLSKENKEDILNILYIKPLEENL